MQDINNLHKWSIITINKCFVLKQLISYMCIQIKQHEFREKFRQGPFFLFICEHPHEALDEVIFYHLLALNWKLSIFSISTIKQIKRFVL